VGLVLGELQMLTCAARSRGFIFYPARVKLGTEADGEVVSKSLER
jgi:hypothetical protein